MPVSFLKTRKRNSESETNPRDMKPVELEQRRAQPAQRIPLHADAEKPKGPQKRRGRKPTGEPTRTVHRSLLLTPAEDEKLQRDYQASGKPSLNQYVLWNLGL